jgi:hypothetical protein
LANIWRIRGTVYTNGSLHIASETVGKYRFQGSSSVMCPTALLLVKDSEIVDQLE